MSVFECKNSIIKILLALLLVLSLAIKLVPSYSYAVSQEEIDALEEERDELEKQRKAQQENVEDLEEKQASVIERKEALEKRNTTIIEQMNLNSKEIELYGEMISSKALEVEQAKSTELEQLEKYRTRVRAMEENGSYDILALILNANSLGELLTAMDDIGEIMSADKTLEDEYIAAREKTESVKAEYELIKEELEAKQKELGKNQKELEKQLEESDRVMAELTESLAKEEALLDEFESALDATQAEIDSLIAQYEKEKQAAAAAAIGATGYTGPAVTGTTNFAWPVSCRYITSSVGYRWHPVSGIWKYHSGMDVGCAYGDPISASDTGTVCIAGWNGGYGNCVMIDHNNGYYTLYGHMSSIAVSVNQTVSKGQVIGYVGSTGVSTGPHLHFEIRSAESDGTTSCLDFSSWFANLTYAPDSGGA